MRPPEHQREGKRAVEYHPVAENDDTAEQKPLHAVNYSNCPDAYFRALKYWGNLESGFKAKVNGETESPLTFQAR